MRRVSVTTFSQNKGPAFEGRWKQACPLSAGYVSLSSSVPPGAANSTQDRLCSRGEGDRGGRGLPKADERQAPGKDQARAPLQLPALLSPGHPGLAPRPGTLSAASSTPSPPLPARSPEREPRRRQTQHQRHSGGGMRGPGTSPRSPAALIPALIPLSILSAGSQADIAAGACSQPLLRSASSGTSGSSPRCLRYSRLRGLPSSKARAPRGRAEGLPRLRPAVRRNRGGRR